MADMAAKQAAQGAMILAAEQKTKEPKDYYDIRETSFRYTPEDHKQMEKLKIVHGYSPYGVAETEDGKSKLPQEGGRHHVTNLHQLTHLGTKKLKDIIRHSDYHVMGFSDIAQKVVQNCKVCALTNAGHHLGAPGKRLRGDRPGAYWEVNFTEVKPAKYGSKYLLVFIDTFSEWVEAFPTKRETANVVAKKILEEIFPRFGIPKVIGSDNGPAFVAQNSQALATQLGIN